MLHVSPPQSPHDEIRSSPLANAGRLGRGQSELDAACALFRTSFRWAMCARRRTRRPPRRCASRRRSSPRNILSPDRRAGGRGRLRRLCLLPADHRRSARRSSPSSSTAAKSRRRCRSIRRRNIGSAGGSRLTGLPLMYWHYMLKGHERFPATTRPSKATPPEAPVRAAGQSGEARQGQGLRPWTPPRGAAPQVPLGNPAKGGALGTLHWACGEGEGACGRDTGVRPARRTNTGASPARPLPLPTRPVMESRGRCLWWGSRGQSPLAGFMAEP